MPRTAALLASLAVVGATMSAALPAAAQSSNLNSINDSLVRQGESRNMQQQHTSDMNMQRMDTQRSQQAAPPPPPSVVPRR